MAAIGPRATGEHQYRALNLLVATIILFAAVATSAALLSDSGPGPREYVSVHGKPVTLYGKGVYRNMSAAVAPQGLAQDVITLFLGIPLLVLGSIGANRGSLRALLLLSGTMAYFLVTYLFYLMMGMFNELFLVYVVLLGCSFFGFLICMEKVRVRYGASHLRPGFPRKFIAGFLVFNAATITLLWLSVVIPPLARSEAPAEVEHYTTLVVQGLDLALLLPLCFVVGTALWHSRMWAYPAAFVYSVFLAILMCALSAKIIAMALQGQNVMPAALIIPVMNLASAVCCLLWFRYTISAPSGDRR